MKRRTLTGIVFALIALWVWAVSHGVAGSVQSTQTRAAAHSSLHALRDAAQESRHVL